MSLPFRPFHPPIFVPWSDVGSVAKAGFPWSEKKNVPLQVDREVAGEIEKRSQGRWTMPELD